MSVISPFLALQHVAMYIRNHGVGIRGIVLNIRNGGVHVDNSYMNIDCKFGLGIKR